MLEYGVRNKRVEFRNWHSYFPDFLYNMTRAGKAGEFSPCERMFVCQLKMVVVKLPIIREKFMKRCGKITPYRSAMKAMAKKLKTKFSVWAQSMRRCGNLAKKHSLTR